MDQINLSAKFSNTIDPIITPIMMKIIIKQILTGKKRPESSPNKAPNPPITNDAPIIPKYIKTVHPKTGKYARLSALE